MRALVAGMLALVAVASGSAADQVPSAPSDDTFVHDLAHLLGPRVEERVQKLAEEAYRQFNSPIVVVTIESARDYGASRIELLARHWFNTWEIGTLGLEGGTNQGILLMVAARDRKARIELGATWGHDWDAESQEIMDRRIVPHFKRGDYPGGILAGVEALLDMARSGPDSHPPRDFLEDTVEPMCKFTFFGPRMFLALVGGGLALVVAGIFFPERRWTLIGIGAAMILIGAFSFILFCVIGGGIGGGRSRGSSSGGGGYSGGFSGGGGASGSW